jgi:5-hydroxyisourate hydrolase
MSAITTHVLDVSIGRPAEGVPVTLEVRSNGAWKQLARRRTDADGRIRDLLPAGSLRKGLYRIAFETAVYFRRRRVKAFYPVVSVVFEIARPKEHHHVPLLVSPFCYSTYRGS